MGVVDNLEALLAQGTDNALLRFALANEYLKLGQHAQAIQHLRQAVAHDPLYSAAWKRLGKALAETGQHEAAKTTFVAGIRAATERGDIQAAKEMQVFLKRLQG